MSFSSNEALKKENMEVFLSKDTKSRQDNSLEEEDMGRSYCQLDRKRSSNKMFIDARPSSSQKSFADRCTVTGEVKSNHKLNCHRFINIHY